ncbi:aldose 1-epimerase family protein [Teichococcus vastitatis]|uniref:Aldose 1-epimerase family protein n=1 Tax=Teichococcus vastitatis TaxID=2307076 RepID=A0ABS9WDX5_9PROT|nr:aldose 1-epimerase family protein [Pseudoroseomonas vastitatis]MCI0756945.1 aldose 1-epimerase family protein [Pseudoroseomonas vastitatis]
MTATIPLFPELATEAERRVLTAGELTAGLFRYGTGVPALRLRNGRGEVVVLPWMGGMIWSAQFDGVDLAMQSGFDAPRPASTIAETYGCFAFHSGLLRNGVPSAEDDHPAHGEFPCAAMDRAFLECGEDEGGAFLRLVSVREHVMGFGAHYLAQPRVTLRPGDSLFDIGLSVRNLSGKPMELMYMCHVNFAFVPGGRCVQPVPFTPERTVVRRAVPAHVRPDPGYLALIDDLARDPARMAVLGEPELYDPEQVFYLKRPGTDARGDTHLMLQRPQGDGFALSYPPAAFPHTVRWILNDPDQKVAAFALPSTCEPEGYAAEQRKGHVRQLPPGGQAEFRVRAGYLDAGGAGRMASLIQGLEETRP